MKPISYVPRYRYPGQGAFWSRWHYGSPMNSREAADQYLHSLSGIHPEWRMESEVIDSDVEPVIGTDDAGFPILL